MIAELMGLPTGVIADIRNSLRKPLSAYVDRGENPPSFTQAPHNNKTSANLLPIVSPMFQMGMEDGEIALEVHCSSSTIRALRDYWKKLKKREAGVEARKSYRKVTPHQSLQKRQAQQEPTFSTRPAHIDPLKLVRCAGCGGLVNLPCVLCTVRKSKKSLAESLI